MSSPQKRAARARDVDAKFTAAIDLSSPEKRILRARNAVEATAVIRSAGKLLFFTIRKFATAVADA